MAREVRSLGHEVVEADRVSEAIRMAEQQQFDCALVDYELHRESGVIVLQALRAHQPRCGRVLVTGLSGQRVLEEAVNQGAIDKVVYKPWSRARLNEAVQLGIGIRHVQLEEPRLPQLHEALQPNMLGMAKQSIQRVDDGEQEVAYEALLRPKHTAFRGPLDLIEVAEMARRLPDLCSIIMEKAAGLLGGIPLDTMLFVNLHRAQLGWHERLEADLDRFLGAADRVVFEITETRPLDGIPNWEQGLKLIRARGFRIALDDLGAGYSSLVSLADLDPHFIKLDRTLVHRVHAYPSRQRVVRLLQQFADSTGARLIAEGVETHDERRALIDCGVQWMQGFLWGRPSQAPDGDPLA